MHVEVVIGASKHLLKKHVKNIPSEFFCAVEKVSLLFGVATQVLNDLSRTVVMCSTIIYDYLNLDWTRVGSVLNQGKYSLLSECINTLFDNFHLND